MTNQQIEWARQHDWFLAEGDDNDILVREPVVGPDGSIVDAVSVWDDFDALREWAGY